MARYFFHIHDDEGPIWDEEGIEFADDAAAKREGQTSLLEMLTQDLRSGMKITGRRIEVIKDGLPLAIFEQPRLVI